MTFNHLKCKLYNSFLAFLFDIIFVDILVSFLLISSLHSTSSTNEFKKCDKTGDCQCRTDTGDEINLMPFDTEHTAYIDSTKVTWRPCKNEVMCEGFYAVACKSENSVSKINNYISFFNVADVI